MANIPLRMDASLDTSEIRIALVQIQLRATIKVARVVVVVFKVLMVIKIVNVAVTMAYTYIWNAPRQMVIPITATVARKFILAPQSIVSPDQTTALFSTFKCPEMINEGRMQALIYVFTLMRLTMGCIFLISGLDKSGHPHHFASTVNAYKILPYRWMTYPFAFLIISSEISMGLLLIVGLQIKAVALMSILLVTSFVFAIGIALIRNQDIECGCFGKNHSRKISFRTFVFDIGLLIACIMVFLNREIPDILTLDFQIPGVQNIVFQFILLWLLPVLLISIGTLLTVKLSRSLLGIISLLSYPEEKV